MTEKIIRVTIEIRSGDPINTAKAARGYIWDTLMENFIQPGEEIVSINAEIDGEES